MEFHSVYPSIPAVNKRRTKEKKFCFLRQCLAGKIIFVSGGSIVSLNWKY